MKYSRFACAFALSSLTVLGFPLACSGGDGSDRVELPNDGGTVTLSIDPPSATKPVGQTQVFEGIATGPDAATQEVTNYLEWTSSDPKVATINKATGVATAVSAGTVTITARWKNVVATAKFTVTTTAAIPDASVDAPIPPPPDGATSDASAPDGGGDTPDSSGTPEAGAPDAEPDAAPTGPTTRIYVSSLGSEVPSSIRIFALDAEDNAKPVASIVGANTKLLGPSQMAIAGNELYVANGEGKGILVFDLDDVFDVNADGNVAPKRAITGYATTFSNFSPMGIVLHGGAIFVSDGAKGILKFPLDGDGDIAPTPIGPLYFYGAHLANSNVANEILIAIPRPTSEVRGYSDTATASDAPLRVLGPDRAWARGVTTTATEIFVVTTGLVDHTIEDAIAVFAADAQTGADPLRAIAGLANTGLHDPHGISVHAGEAYVAIQSEHAVRIFDATANGDVAPRRIIKGGNTGLSFPAGVLVATTGN